MSKLEFVFFFYGEDRWGLQEERQRWKRAFIEKQASATNLEEWEGDQVDLNELRQSLLAMPFLGEKRLVIVKNLLENWSTEDQKELIPLLEKIPDTTIVMFLELKEPDKRTSLFKELSKRGNVRQFLKPKGAQLVQWTLRQVQKMGGQMDEKNTSYLLGLLGDDLWKIQNELQKICLFAEGQPITREIIDGLVANQVQKSIFAMTDALGLKNSKGALKLVDELISGGEDPAFVFAMVARQFRLLLEIKARTEERMNPAAIASRMKVHPFVVSTAMKQCRNFTYQQLESALRKLLDMDRRLKRGRLHLSGKESAPYLLALEKVLMEL